MTRALKVLLAACALSLVASAATAAPITLTFNARITDADDLVGATQFSGIGVGDILSGSLTYDPDTTATSPFSANDVVYFFGNTGTHSFQVTLNGHSFDGPLSFGRVWNNLSAPNPVDQAVFFGLTQYSVSSFGASEVSMLFAAASDDPAFLSSSALPSGALDASLLSGQSSFSLSWNFGGQRYGLDAELTNEEPASVPEPAVLPLLSTGLMGLAAGRFRRRRSRS